MLACYRKKLEICPVFPFFYRYMAQGQCIPTTYVLTPVSLNHFLLQPKSLHISCVVSNFYDTEFKILVGLGWLAVLKISAILLKQPTFKGDLLILSQNKLEH